MSDAIVKARAAWGETIPPWVTALAEECDQRRSQAQAGRVIGYSASVVNQVLGNSYAGDLSKVEAAARGALLGETVDCPVAGDITRDRCLKEQGRPLDAGNPQRVRFFKACRGGCPHSRIAEGRRS